MATRMDIKDLSLEELAVELVGMGEPAFRAKQVFAWLYRRGKTTFGEFSDLSRGLRERLAERFVIGRLEAVERLRSADAVQKLLFRLGDGARVEAVVIPSGDRRTVCLSTQAGCKFACAFCASGLGGFHRDLTPSEITGQVLFVKDVLGEEPTNLVFMGMGEPLDNFDSVAKAVRILNSPEGAGIAARRMTVSTCGIVPGIDRLAKLDLQINLSLSLHAVTDRLRDRLMPVNRKYPLEEVVRAAEAYLEAGGRMMTLEYILIRDVNDSRTDAEGLAGIARRLRAKVNLIAYSPVPGLEFARPDDAALGDFVGWLEERRVNVTVRRSKGVDIAAACGQLAGRGKGEAAGTRGPERKRDSEAAPGNARVKGESRRWTAAEEGRGRPPAGKVLSSSKKGGDVPRRVGDRNKGR